MGNQTNWRWTGCSAFTVEVSDVLTWPGAGGREEEEEKGSTGMK